MIMPTKNTETIHALTTAEVGRQVKMYSERRQQIDDERAAAYAYALKNGGAPDTPVVDADERAALEHAKNLLNGYAPQSLSLPPEISRDRILLRERRGLDIVLKILADKDLVARAAEAVEWGEAHGAEWHQLTREITLTAIRLHALEQSAQRLLAGCPDLFAVRLPMTVISNSPSIAEIPLDDLKGAALAEGIITHAEIRKAEKHGQ
jgi:hypothetical protein